MKRHIVTAVGATALLLGCASAPPATPTPPTSAPTTAPTGTQSPAATPTDRPSPTARPSASRIAFGRFDYFDPSYGVVVALWTVDPDGTNLAQLNEGKSAFPAWSPDGRLLAYTTHMSDGSLQIATMAPDGSDVKILTTAAYLAEVPSWSPDRTWIAYDYASVALDGSSFHTSLYRMNADGTQPQLLGDPDTFDVEPKISPDGKSVLFERLTFPGGNQHNALMIRDIATGTERHLDSAGEFVEHANWSPDGLWVICNVAHALTSTVANDQIERVRADGSAEPEVLLKGTSTQTGFKASYSPDGASIVFGCFGSAGDTATCVMNADGSNVHVVADEPNVDENQFSWGVTPAS